MYAQGLQNGLVYWGSIVNCECYGGSNGHCLNLGRKCRCSSSSERITRTSSSSHRNILAALVTQIAFVVEAMMLSCTWYITAKATQATEKYFTSNSDTLLYQEPLLQEAPNPYISTSAWIHKSPLQVHVEILEEVLKTARVCLGTLAFPSVAGIQPVPAAAARPFPNPTLEIAHIQEGLG